MGRRNVRIGIILVILLAASIVACATEPKVTYLTTERNGFAELQVQTPLANYVFSEDGGTIRSVLLTFAPYGAKPAELVPGTTSDIKTLARTYYANAEFPFLLLETGTSFTYKMQDPTYDESGALIVELDGTSDAMTVVKRFTIKPDALYTLTAEVEIQATDALSDPVHLVLANYTPTSKGRQLTYLYNDQAGTAQLAQGPSINFQGLGLMDNEVVFFLGPDSTTPVVPFAEMTQEGTRRIGVSLSASAGTSSYRFTLYGGRRRYISMEAAGIQALDNPGVFARLMVYVIRFLNWLYDHTGNYGWAIIIFTILMRILLFPLMRKQYHSMARIQQIQPRLKRVQERYKDNKEEMQKKILEIYRKEKVNPMSGCFPMALQLPIIIIIWRALLYASEQIHLSPGFLWIPDLSLADPYFILVIVTTLIMLLQQYFMAPMTTGDSSGMQKYMGYFFPLLMAFLLWKFPAGLWLYYLLTTAAQVGQQAFVNWEMARAGGGTASTPDDFIDIDGTSESGDGESA